MNLQTLEGKEIATLLTPTTVTLVTARDGSGDCVATCAWANPLSHDPSLIGVCLRPGGRTADAIESDGCFVVNVLSAGTSDIAIACGKKGPDQPERFEAAGLTSVAAEQTRAVRIDEAMGWIECKLIETHDFGDHRLFVGETLIAQSRGGEPLLMEGRSAFGRFRED